MNTDKVVYVVRLVLEWIIIGCAVCAMVCDMIEPGSANGFVWALVAGLSGIRCVMGTAQNRRLEKRLAEWVALTERAVEVAEYSRKKMQAAVMRNAAEENDLK